MKRNRILARFIALHGVRNSYLEDLHSGITPGSKTGDYSDVKVVTPYGEIQWAEPSRISDKEMRKLMLEIEKLIYQVPESIPKMEERAGSPQKWKRFLKRLVLIILELHGM